MKQTTAKSTMLPVSNEYLTISDVKDYLKISQSAAYALTRSKDFPVSRFGASIRIPKREFLAWVALKTVVPISIADYLNAAEMG